MPSAQAHLPDDGSDPREADAAPDEDRPILLDDIDAALRDSAAVPDAQEAASIRAWRETLAPLLETLTYAHGVLADDVGILRHRLDTDAPSAKEVVDDLPGVLAERPAEGSSVPDRTTPGPDFAADFDPGVFARSDSLVVGHAEMATVDFTSADDVRRVLGVLEEQMAVLSGRHHAVRVRLDELRAALIRRYEDGAIPTSNGAP